MTTTAKIGLTSIVSLGIGFLISYFIYTPQMKDFSGLKSKKDGTVPTEKGKINIKAYQDKLAYARLSLHPNYKVKGILHDTTKIKNYYDSVFLKFAQTHTAKENHHWEVGLYPNVCYDSITKKNRLNIYFIPTMVKGKHPNQDIVEYYEAITGEDSAYYKTTNKRWKDDEEYIFDQGTLFP